MPKAKPKLPDTPTPPTPLPHATRRNVRVLGYIRCSTEEQAQEGMSLAYQRRKIQEYASLHDLEIADILEDPGYSGKDTQRPAFQKLLTEIEDPAIEGVLSYRLDRLTRSLGDLAQLLEVFKTNNASIYSVMENLDVSTAMGRFVIGLLGLLGTLEVEVLGERVAAGMQEAKRQGIHTGSSPLGFKHSADRTLVEEPEQKATIARILAFHNEGRSLRDICKLLNQEGRQTKRGGKWAPETVRLVIHRAKEGS